MTADKILVVIEILVVKEISGYLDGARTRFGLLLRVIAHATNGELLVCRHPTPFGFSLSCGVCLGGGRLANSHILVDHWG